MTPEERIAAAATGLVDFLRTEARKAVLAEIQGATAVKAAIATLARDEARNAVRAEQAWNMGRVREAARTEVLRVIADSPVVASRVRKILREELDSDEQWELTGKDKALIHEIARQEAEKVMGGQDACPRPADPLEEGITGRDEVAHLAARLYQQWRIRQQGTQPWAMLTPAEQQRWRRVAVAAQSCRYDEVQRLRHERGDARLRADLAIRRATAAEQRLAAERANQIQATVHRTRTDELLLELGRTIYTSKGTLVLTGPGRTVSSIIAELDAEEGGTIVLNGPAPGR